MTDPVQEGDPQGSRGAAAGGGLFLPAARGLRGEVTAPGDKSVSHRAVLLSAVSDGPVHVSGFLRSADTLATVRAARALGVTVDEDGHSLVIHGRGWEGLSEPEDVIDVANSGTLIRLLPGLSIRRRPMARVLQPLTDMGAAVAGRKGNSLPPISLRGGALRGITHEMKVASAQVKSCVLLAGLRAHGETAVVEPAASRDHTERMIRFAGGRVEREGSGNGPGTVRVWPVDSLHMERLTVPGDISSAAFWMVAALLVPGSEIAVTNVGLNPTRTGLLAVLRRMGADLEVQPGDMLGPEPVGRVTARTSSLTATDVGADEVPSLIDELPLFLLAAARAHGTSHLRGAAELRAKESDRIQAMAALLRALGVEIEELPDGMDVTGVSEPWRGGSVQAHADHRLAMVAAIAGAASHEGVLLDNVGCIGVSYPTFLDTFGNLGGSWAARPDAARLE